MTARVRRTIAISMFLVAASALSSKAQAAIELQTIVRDAAGRVVVGQFDDSLGIMTGASVRVEWGRTGPALTGVANGDPSAVHRDGQCSRAEHDPLGAHCLRLLRL